MGIGGISRSAVDWEKVGGTREFMNRLSHMGMT